MNTELLAIAKNSLLIQDVFIKECHLESGQLVINGQFDVQFRHETVGHQVFEMQQLEQLVQFIDFQVMTELRFLSGKEENALAHAEIRALFVARYSILPDTQLEEPVLQEFGKHNALFHVWPYWRELAASMTSRARLPTVTLPMLVMQANKD